MKKTIYYRIKGQRGVYILTRKEMERALDRENYGRDLDKNTEIKKEKDF